MMMSFREFVKNKLLKKLVEDIKNFRIFNEADLQYRVAHHLDKKYFKEYWLLNQPKMPVGKKSGRRNRRPDIVLFNKDCSPVAAFELKCFIDKGEHSVVRRSLKDIEKLKKFGERYLESKNAFAIILVRMDDKDLYTSVQKEFRKDKEDWMKHYLKVHVINVCRNVKGRKYKWYKAQWLKEYEEWKKDLSRL